MKICLNEDIPALLWIDHQSYVTHSYGPCLKCLFDNSLQKQKKWILLLSYYSWIRDTWLIFKHSSYSVTIVTLCGFKSWNILDCYSCMVHVGWWPSPVTPLWPFRQCHCDEYQCNIYVHANTRSTVCKNSSVTAHRKWTGNTWIWKLILVSDNTACAAVTVHMFLFIVKW